MIDSDDSQQEGSPEIRNIIRIFNTFYFALFLGLTFFLEIKFEIITLAWNFLFP